MNKTLNFYCEGRTSISLVLFSFLFLLFCTSLVSSASSFPYDNPSLPKLTPVASTGTTIKGEETEVTLYEKSK